MEFTELIKSRRSIRKYMHKPMPLEIIHELIKLSTFAPNAGNEQSWKFIVVNNKEMLKRMSDESKKNILARIAVNPNDYASKYKGMLKNENFNVFYNAPCLVIILGPANLKNLFVDCALAASYFMMAAASKGLGTCWINLGTEIKDQEMIDQLGIPDNSRIVAPIILGYPEKIPSAPKRREPEILKTIT